MPRKIGFTLLLFLLAGHCWAAAVLDTNSSASSLGFGGRNTAVVQNAADWLANPAGLTDLKSVQFGSTYANLFWEDIGYLYLGSTFPLQDKGVTFAAAYREIKTDIDYDLSYLEAASTFAVGYELSQSLSVGLALNRINVQSLYSGTGFSLDLGLLKKQGFGQIGASIKNVYSSLSYSTGLTEKIEPRFNFGMVYNLNRRNRVFLEMDNLSFISLGFEHSLFNGIALRCGVNENGFTAGTGFDLGPWSFDYALFNNGLELEHRLSAVFQL